MLEEKILSKYGGSSITNLSDIERISKITEDDHRRSYIVVSAPGTRFDGDTKVTQLLVQLAGFRSNDRPSRGIIDEIVSRFEHVYSKTCSSEVGDRLIERFNQNLAPEPYMASLKAFGEETNARLLAESLGYNFIDPREFMFLSNSYDNAKVLKKSYDKIKQLVKQEGVLVFPGFYGVNKKEEISTFSFGGSDLTGAILSKGLGVIEYENFTDCSIYSADPRIVKDPRKIEEMTYKELRDLSYSGFNIFHQDAVHPLEDSGIPIHIRSTKNYPEQGTRVVTERVCDLEESILGVAYKGGFCSFSVSKSGLNGMTGVLNNITSVFSSKGIGIEYAPVGVDDVSIVAVEKDLESKSHPDEIIKELKKTVGDNSLVNFYDNLGTLVVAGKALKRDIKTMGEIIINLSENNIDIRSVSCGEEKRCYMFGLNSKDGNKAVKIIYDSFIR